MSSIEIFLQELFEVLVESILDTLKDSPPPGMDLPEQTKRDIAFIMLIDIAAQTEKAAGLAQGMATQTLLFARRMNPNFDADIQRIVDALSKPASKIILLNK